MPTTSQRNDGMRYAQAPEDLDNCQEGRGRRHVVPGGRPAPKGQRHIAPGGAKRNPGLGWSPQGQTPEGWRKQSSVAPPELGYVFTFRFLVSYQSISSTLNTAVPEALQSGVSGVTQPAPTVIWVTTLTSDCPASGYRTDALGWSAKSPISSLLPGFPSDTTHPEPPQSPVKPILTRTGPPR